MEVYIHIGTEKTGTTSLQNFFQLNREVLAENGIWYPKCVGIEKHFSLSIYCRAESIMDDLNARTDLNSIGSIRKFKNELPGKLLEEMSSLHYSPRKLILSSEHLSSRLFNRHELEKLKELVSLFSAKPKIVIYLRRQDEFLISSYSTYIKSGGTEEFTIPEIDQELAKRYDYLKMLDLWSDVFEKENIVVRIYDKKELKKEDIIVDFLDQIQVDFKESYAIPKRRNETFSNSNLEFLRRFNSLVPCIVDSKLNPEWSGIIETLSNCPNKDAFSNYDEKKLQIFYNYFAESNNTVAKKYLNRTDGILFRENEAGTNKIKADFNFSMENLMNISVQIWKIKNAETQRLIFRKKILEAELYILKGNLDKARYLIQEAESLKKNKKDVDDLKKLLNDAINTKQKSRFSKWFSK